MNAITAVLIAACITVVIRGRHGSGLGAISAFPGVLSRPSMLRGRDFGIPRRIFAPEQGDRARFLPPAAYFRAHAG